MVAGLYSHCVKRVSILRISPYLVRMRENAGKMRTRITPNTDSFYGVSHTYLRLKDALKGLIHFLTTENPLQMMENVFHLKMSFHFQDI